MKFILAVGTKPLIELKLVKNWHQFQYLGEIYIKLPGTGLTQLFAHDIAIGLHQKEGVIQTFSDFALVEDQGKVSSIEI
jgi:hypothetical protein